MNANDYPTNMECLRDVRIAPHLIGIDATASDVQQFVSWFSNAKVGDGDVNFVRREMEERANGKAYDTKADRSLQFALFLISTSHGRHALRQAARRASREDLLDLFVPQESK